MASRQGGKLKPLKVVGDEIWRGKILTIQ
jgi:hypothetical protein